jgi:hypothetical protein
VGLLYACAALLHASSPCILRAIFPGSGVLLPAPYAQPRPPDSQAAARYSPLRIRTWFGTTSTNFTRDVSHFLLLKLAVSELADNTTKKIILNWRNFNSKLEGVGCVVAVCVCGCGCRNLDSVCVVAVVGCSCISKLEKL